VVFNDALRTRDAAHRAGEKISDTEVQRRVVTLAKTSPEREWLGEVASVALVQACQDARRAYRNWFDSLSGKRKGRRVGHPRFRSRKDNRQSICLTRNGFGVTARGVRVAKVGNVRLEWSRDLPSVPSSVTVIREADGRYYASFVVQVQDTPLPMVSTDVGVDLGLTSLAVLSTGEIIENPRYLRRKARALSRAQHALSRKEKGSNNRRKAQGAGNSTGRAPQTGSPTDPRQPSGVRRRPCGVRVGPYQAGEIRARRRLGHLGSVVGGEGGTLPSAGAKGGSLVPVVSVVFAVWDGVGPETAAGPGMDLRRLRSEARPR
jgi:hypothetical protein